MEKIKSDLYIPQGLKQKREYYDGFGKKELVIVVIGTLIGAIIDTMIYLVAKSLLAAVFIIMAVPTTLVMLTIKENNISVIDQVLFLIHYYRSQKYYPYIGKEDIDIL